MVERSLLTVSLLPAAMTVVVVGLLFFWGGRVSCPDAAKDLFTTDPPMPPVEGSPPVGSPADTGAAAAGAAPESGDESIAAAIRALTTAIEASRSEEKPAAVQRERLSARLTRRMLAAFGGIMGVLTGLGATLLSIHIWRRSRLSPYRSVMAGMALVFVVIDVTVCLVTLFKPDLHMPVLAAILDSMASGEARIDGLKLAIHSWVNAVAGSANSDRPFSGNSGRSELTPSAHTLAASSSEGRDDRHAHAARDTGPAASGTRSLGGRLKTGNLSTGQNRQLPPAERDP